MDSRTRPYGLINRNLFFFMLAMMLANIGSSMYALLLPLYLKEMGASVAQIGLYFTVAQFVPLLLQVLGGWVSDSIGRLRGVVLGSVAGNLGFIGFLLAPTWQWMLIGEFFHALNYSLVGPSYAAYVADQSSDRQRGRTFGFTEMMVVLVGVIGPPLGGWLAHRFGFRLMLLVAWTFYFLATLIRVVMSHRAWTSGKLPMKPLHLADLWANMKTLNRVMLAGGLIIWLIGVYSLFEISNSMSTSLMPLFAEEIGGMNFQQIGLLGAIFGLSTMVGNLPGGWLADKRGEQIGIAFGLLLQAAGLVGFVQAGSFGGYALGWILFGLGGGMMSPAFDTLISRAVPAGMRGTAYGMFNATVGLAAMPAPAINAQIWQRISPRFPFVLGVLASLFGIIPALFKLKRPTLPPGGQDLPVHRNE